MENRNLIIFAMDWLKQESFHMNSIKANSIIVDLDNSKFKSRVLFTCALLEGILSKVEESHLKVKLKSFSFTSKEIDITIEYLKNKELNELDSSGDLGDWGASLKYLNLIDLWFKYVLSDYQRDTKDKLDISLRDIEDLGDYSKTNLITSIVEFKGTV